MGGGSGRGTGVRWKFTGSFRVACLAVMLCCTLLSCVGVGVVYTVCAASLHSLLCTCPCTHTLVRPNMPESHCSDTQGSNSCRGQTNCTVADASLFVIGSTSSHLHG